MRTSKLVHSDNLNELLEFRIATREETASNIKPETF